MLLIINDNNQLIAGRAILESDLSPEYRAARMVERGYRPVLALAIAHGELSTTMGAKRVARLAGLTTVETGDARTKGLLR